MAVFDSMRADWNSSDRLLLMIVLASILHAVVILGVSFDLPKPEKIKKSLDIALVLNPSRQAPETADYLAHENQFGSGLAEKKATPKAEPVPQAGRSEQTEQVPSPAPTPVAKPKPVLKQAKSEKKVVQDVGTQEQSEAERPRISADALSQQIAELSAELNKSHEEQARSPRIVYINSVNAHKYKAAAYEKAWQEKVERIGNLNYPDEARRQNLSGALLLSVAVKPDGSVYSIQVRRSSGYSALDDAAVRIVRLAAPFAPFPGELAEEADVLVITRTWNFSNEYRMQTSP
jgi:protein TonB